MITLLIIIGVCALYTASAVGMATWHDRYGHKREDRIGAVVFGGLIPMLPLIFWISALLNRDYQGERVSRKERKADERIRLANKAKQEAELLAERDKILTRVIRGEDV